MDIALILGFILFGLALIVVEIIFIPGTTIAGIGGFVCSAYGVYLSFQEFGTQGGILTVIFTVTVSLIALVVSFKTRSWELFSLKKTMKSKVNEEFRLPLNVGDQGVTISSLRPIGKALFNDHELEVTSLDGFVEEKQAIKIIKVEGQKVIVEKEK